MAVRHAGELRWKIYLLEPGTPSKSTSGARTTPNIRWAGPVPAKVEELDGTESPAHGSRDATQVSLVTIRQEGLSRRPKKTDAVEFGNRTLNVFSVKDPDQMGRWWELLCRESV